MNAMIRSAATVLGALSLTVITGITATALAGEMTGGTPAPTAMPASALTAGAGWQ